MAASFRRRLLAIAFLTVLVCGAAIADVLFLSRLTLDERTAHATDNVTREVERMRSTVDQTDSPSADIRSGELWSGYVTDSNLVGASGFRRQSTHVAHKLLYVSSTTGFSVTTLDLKEDLADISRNNWHGPARRTLLLTTR